MKPFTSRALLSFSLAASVLLSSPGVVYTGAGNRDAANQDSGDESVEIANAEVSPVSDVSLLPGGDTRSERLRAITRTWNTDWERRTIEYHELLHGGPPRDGIPPLDDPTFVSTRDAGDWLEDNEPVIAFVEQDDARAYPLQILIWHEIVNDIVGDTPVLVTFCPLCNSSIVFDRRVKGEVYEFGTSGLLRNSDLVMYDRTTESLWQQLTGNGIVGDHAGDRLTFLPSSIVSFGDFREAYPLGKILSRETGYTRNYGSNPYVGYDRIGQSPFLYNGEVDGRLTAMERVVAVTLMRGNEEINVAYPYAALARAGVINDVQGGVHLVVFHEEGTSSALDSRDIKAGRDIGATGVFSPVVDGKVLTFARRGGTLRDRETGSTWDIFGRAVKGTLAGTQLEPVVHGDHFWFAWAAFKPKTVVYGSS
jgi:hypothetical protein